MSPCAATQKRDDGLRVRKWLARSERPRQLERIAGNKELFERREARERANRGGVGEQVVFDVHDRERRRQRGRQARESIRAHIERD